MTNTNNENQSSEVERGKRSDSAPCSACCGAPRGTNGSADGTRWYQCAKCGAEFIDARETIGYKLGRMDTEKKVSAALRGDADSELFGEGGLIAATMNASIGQSRLLAECSRYIRATEDESARSLGIDTAIRSKSGLEIRLNSYMPND